MKGRREYKEGENLKCKVVMSIKGNDKCSTKKPIPSAFNE